MQNYFVNIVAWHFRRKLNQFGWGGVIGLMLLTLCVPFYLLAVIPNATEMQLYEKKVRLVPSHSTIDINKFRLNPKDQLSKFYQVFPKLNNYHGSLETLHRAATAWNISLNRGDYALVRDKSNKLIRYEISLPIKGNYVDIRNFLSQILADAPNISLDSVNFERQEITDTTVDAQIKLTLYFVES